MDVYEVIGVQISLTDDSGFSRRVSISGKDHFIPASEIKFVRADKNMDSFSGQAFLPVYAIVNLDGNQSEVVIQNQFGDKNVIVKNEDLLIKRTSLEKLAWDDSIIE